MASELFPVPSDLSSDVTIRGLNATQCVFGRYNLRRILGRGGMGIVWLAHDERLDRDVALKFLPDEVFFDPAALDELKRETRRCLDLTHPNIIRIYDFITDEQAAAISMEYIDGKTLAELRIEKPNRVFEVDEISGWVGSICQALHYAHTDVGVVHRDLKPANLMLTSRDQLKIADFGISQSMADSMSRRTVRRGTSSGTLGYMSPQQLNGDVARPSDDIYALGATIYELLTGKPPFHSGDVPFQIRLNMPKSLAVRRAEFGITGSSIPLVWEETIEACLSKIPAERPSSMGEVAERLSGRGLLPSIDASIEIERPKVTPVAADAPPPALPPRATARVPIIPIVAAIVPVIAVVLVTYFSLRPTAHPANTTVLYTPTVAVSDPAPVPGPSPVLADPFGSLRVDSTPHGATVHIDGLPDQTTPALYAKVQPGQYQISISREGYEAERSTVAITSNTKTDTGALQLTRSTGDLSLASIPAQAHYHLVSSGAMETVEREGTTPDNLIALPTGNYEITYTGAGLPPAVTHVVITARQRSVVQSDLIDAAVVHNATPAAIAVFHGSAAISSLDDAGRSQVIALAGQAFQFYLNAGLLDRASAQLDLLRSLNQDTTAEQAEIVSKTSAVEQGFAAEIGQLVAKGKLATAEERMQQLQSTLDAGAVTRIEAPYRVQLAQYESQIDTAVQASQLQPPEAADVPLRALSKQYPDDLSLLLAEAQLLTRMPPDGPAIAAQLKTFQKFATLNKAFAADPALMAIEQVLNDEQHQLDLVTQDLRSAKKGPAALKDEIDELQDREAVYHRRRVGAPKANPFSSAVNFFGKAVTGHRVVDNAPYFDSSEDKRAAIAELQARIDQDKASLATPPADLQDAQNRYDQFMAKVPWEPAPAAAVNPAP